MCRTETHFFIYLNSISVVHIIRHSLTVVFVVFALVACSTISPFFYFVFKEYSYFFVELNLLSTNSHNPFGFIVVTLLKMFYLGDSSSIRNFQPRIFLKAHREYRDGLCAAHKLIQIMSKIPSIIFPFPATFFCCLHRHPKVILIHLALNRARYTLDFA